MFYTRNYPASHNVNDFYMHHVSVFAVFMANTIVNILYLFHIAQLMGHSVRQPYKTESTLKNNCPSIWMQIYSCVSFVWQTDLSTFFHIVLKHFYITHGINKSSFERILKGNLEQTQAAIVFYDIVRVMYFSSSMSIQVIAALNDENNNKSSALSNKLIFIHPSTSHYDFFLAKVASMIKLMVIQ